MDAGAAAMGCPKIIARRRFRDSMKSAVPLTVRRPESTLKESILTGNGRDVKSKPWLRRWDSHFSQLDGSGTGNPMTDAFSTSNLTRVWDTSDGSLVAVNGQALPSAQRVPSA